MNSIIVIAIYCIFLLVIIGGIIVRLRFYNRLPLKLVIVFCIIGGIAWTVTWIIIMKKS